MAGTPPDGPDERLTPPAADRRAPSAADRHAPTGADRHGRDARDALLDAVHGSPPAAEVAAPMPVRVPRQRARRPPRRRAPVLVAATVTTGWAALASYFTVLAGIGLITLAGGGASLGVIFRFGTAGWLLGHGVPLDTSAGRFGLAPLAISVLAAWRVSRAGVHTSRAIGGRRHGSPRLVVLTALVVALVYGLLGAAAAGLVNGAGLTVTPVRAGLTLGAFGLVAAAIGAALESGLVGTGWARLPQLVRDGLRTGYVAALLLLSAGAGVAGVAVAVNGGDASDILGSYHTGVGGQAGLTVLCLAYAPNFAAWAMAYLVGPGFMVGAGTLVSAGSVNLGALPALPVLAALPDSAVTGLGAMLLGLPLAGGMAAGWLLARRKLQAAAAGPRTEPPVPPWPTLLGTAALAGPVAGVLLGLAGWASGGSLGSGRLAVTGPTGFSVALVATVVVAAGAMIAAAATRVLTVARRG